MKAALIACSDGLSPRAAATLDGVLDALRALGLEAFCAGPLSAPAGACAAPAKERAEAFCKAYLCEILSDHIVQ